MSPLKITVQAAAVTAAWLILGATPILSQTALGSLLNPGGTLYSGGAVYGWGYTQDPNFPVTANAYQRSFPLAVCGSFHGGSIYCPTGYVVKLNATGDQILWATLLGGTAGSEIFSLALDSHGNIWVVGGTNSQDFPVTPNALQSAFGRTFLAELSPDGSQLLYSTFLGGPTKEAGYRVNVDSKDFVYVVGASESATFSTTKGAYKRQPTPGAADLYARKIDPFTNTLIYSTLIGPIADAGDAVNVTYLTTATDDSGVLYVASDTYRPEYPITPGVYSHRSEGRDVLVTAVNPSGIGLIFSTVIGGSGDDYLSGFLRDPAGNLYLSGTTGGRHRLILSQYAPPSPDFPVTPNAMQTSWGPSFLLKLSPDASQLIYSTFFGKSGAGTGLDVAFPQEIHLDEQGRLHILVYSEQSDIPLTPDSASPCYPDWIANRLYLDHWVYVRLAPDMKTIEFATALPVVMFPGGYPLSPYAFDTSGNMYMPSTAGHYFEILNVAQAPPPGPVCIGEFITKQRGPVAPGLLVSIYGPDIGPAQPAWAVPVAGVIPNQLAGVQVMFDDLPASILYAAPNQVDVVVPFAIPTDCPPCFEAFGTTTVSVLRDGSLVGTLTNSTHFAVPWLFSVDGTGYGASAWNPDGTPNSPDHPAHVGDILTFYGAGFGVMTPAVQDGAIPSAPLAAPVYPFFIGGLGRQICSYVGDAPGQVEGIVQFNCQVTLKPDFGIAYVNPTLGVTLRNIIYVQ